MTGIHDRQAAWSGLGSAVNTLWNQLSVPASIWNVAAITGYLMTMAGLKITTPALFRLASVNQVVSIVTNSTLSSPFLLAPLWNESSQQPMPPSAQMIDFALSMASASITKQDPSNTGFGLGLQANMLYDVVSPNTGSGSVKVNTHIMNVTCGTAPEDYVATAYSDLVGTDGRIMWVTTYGVDGLGTSIPEIVSNTAPNILRIIPNLLMDIVGCINSSARQYDLGCFEGKPAVLFYASFNISDTAGQVVSQLLFDPPMNPDTSSRVPLGPAPPRKTFSSWNDYKDVKMQRTDKTELLVRVMIHSQYLMDTLSIQPPNIGHDQWSNLAISQIEKRNGGNVSIANLMLHDFENALEDYAAAFYWSLAYLHGSPTIEDIIVEGYESVSELQVIAGLTLSICLLILAFILIRFGRAADKGKSPVQLNSLGLLETLWLAGEEMAEAEERADFSISLLPSPPGQSENSQDALVGVGENRGQKRPPVSPAGTPRRSCVLRISRPAADGSRSVTGVCAAALNLLLSGSRAAESRRAAAK
ncbi:hypothetical protein B0H19DRAFT_1063020 [Mycena capillaripes]|nr:hypothetical protein B0H19DRAFT_1063020 [Mycena capillaripes]